MEYAFSTMGYDRAALERRSPIPNGGGRPAATAPHTMLHTELLTSIQEGKKIIVVVLGQRRLPLHR